MRMSEKKMDGLEFSTHTHHQQQGQVIERKDDLVHVFFNLRSRRLSLSACHLQQMDHTTSGRTARCQYTSDEDGTLTYGRETETDHRKNQKCRTRLRV